ncbi:MAG: hypothetical protein DSY47_03035 [Hydrogenothermus sp.]|nr:MAG: hypothetical protein DSY47_03035 [Hydrogenothermus sp.]
MKIVKKSLKLKFAIAILAVSLIPFLIFAFVSLEIGKSKLTQNVYEDLKRQSDFLSKVINKDLESIQKQVILWAKFQVFDDIIVSDIDKRVQSFLDKISENLTVKGIIFCTDRNGKVIASSYKNLIGKNLHLPYLKDNFTDLHTLKWFDKYFLKFSAPIYASFDKNRLVGYLAFLYFVDNFNNFIIDKPEKFDLIFNKTKNFVIGKNSNLFDKVIGKEGILLQDKYILVFKRLENSFFRDSWYILSAVDKNFLFKPIYELNRILLTLSVFDILIILATSIFLAKRITNPLEKLTDFVNFIIKKKNYSKTVSIKTDDEIQILADAFNQMINEINRAFKSLERESLERLKLFLKLTETFNKIMKAENVEEVFQIVNYQLKDFPHILELGFSINKIDNAINVRIDTGESKGFLYFKIDGNVSKEEEKFLKSIATFVNLWLERKELLIRAQASSKAKSAFIANMSHELRTPLNSIIGFAQFFQMAEDIPEEYRELAKNIETSGRHLLELINDILDFSKAEAGKLEVNKINTNIYSVVNDTLNIVRAMANEKGIYLKAYIDENLSFKTDVKLLRQILLNLLSNSVKFTEEGGITIKVKKICDRLFISVRDTGIGIEKENLEKLFQDFTQLENPLQKKYKGTGLGLSITKKYIELLGGKIKVYSKGIGKGSRFTFYIGQ